MRHVLVVEDDAYNAMLFRKLLEKRGGYRVSVTDIASEVVALCREGGIALVIMDVSLANTRLDGKPVNGVELCRILKSDPVTVGIPILLATAHAMRGDAERLLAESGADDYLAKPIVDHAAFLDHVRQMLPEAA